MEDAGDYTNTLDITFQFLPAMAAGLAYYISLKRAPDRMSMLKEIYEEEWGRAASENIDTVSSRFIPARTVI